MFKFVLCVALFWFHTSQFTAGFKNSWLDDLDGSKFLRGAEKQVHEENELDEDNASPNEKRVANSDYVTTVTSINEAMICKVAAHANGINTKKWNTSKDAVSSFQPDSFCRPFPTMVEFQSPAHVHYLPSTTILYRCVGSCLGTGQIQNCTVTSQEEVVLSVFEVPGVTPKTITVYNHTACACYCIKRISECDISIHNFNDDKCECVCKNSSTSCEATKAWDEKKCRCECTSAPKLCDRTKNHEWNREICDCDCKQKVKDRCQRKGKVLNKDKCECECPAPAPTCPTGTSFLKYNCTCIPDSVTTK